MKNKFIAYTGERMIPGETPSIFFFEHLRRYYFIKDLCRNKYVLDAGCGNGYGSRFLANYAKNVTAIDIDEGAIKNAQLTYKKSNLKFMPINILNKTLKRRFDIVCSFEVIEHIRHQEKFICNIKDLLKKNGVLIISTPNKMIVSPNSKKPSNPFHVKELSYAEFKNFMLKHFKNVEVYGQGTNNNLSKLVDFMRYIRCNKYFFYISIFILNFIKIIIKRTDIWDYQKNMRTSVKLLEKNIDKYAISKDGVEKKPNFVAVCKNPL